MAWGLGNLLDRVREAEEERQQAWVVKNQAAAFRAWGRLGVGTPMQFGLPPAGALNPQGREYQRERIEDNNLRPRSFLRDLVTRMQEQQAEQERQQQREARAAFRQAERQAEEEEKARKQQENEQQSFMRSLLERATTREGFEPTAVPPRPPSPEEEARWRGPAVEPGRGPGVIIDAPRRPPTGILAGLLELPEVYEYQRQRTTPWTRAAGAFAGETLAEGVIPPAIPGRERAVEAVGRGVGAVTGQISAADLVPIPFVDPLVARVLGIGVRVAGRAAARVAPEALQQLVEVAGRRLAEATLSRKQRIGLQKFYDEATGTLRGVSGAAPEPRFPRPEIPEPELPTFGRPPRVEPGGAAGVVRLYRGESVSTGRTAIPDWIQLEQDRLGITSARSRWFTDDPQIARWYLREAGFDDPAKGRISFIDVPAAEVENYRATNFPEARRFSRDPEREFFVPKGLADQRQPMPGFALRGPTEPAVRRPVEPGAVGAAPPVRPAAQAPPVEELPTVQRLTNFIREAKIVRPKQAVLYGQERARRAGAAAGAMTRAGEGRGALYAAKGELKGPLPRARFEPPETVFGADEIDDLHRQIADFYRPKAKTTFTDINTREALERALLGELPTPSEIRLLATVFGKELGAALRSKRPLGQKAWREFMALTNLPRLIMTTFVDFSALLRQGGLVAPGHPREFLSNVPRYFRFFGSQKYTDDVMDAIRQEPLFTPELAERLGLTSITRGEMIGAEEATMALSEEAFVGRLLGRLPLVKQTARSYEGFLTKLRWDIYKTNLPIVGEQNADALAGYIAAATGRGNLGPLNKFAPELGALFFAARLNVGRAQAPLYMLHFSNKRWSPLAKLAARDAIAFTGFGASLLAALKLSGAADVELNPLATDWGKIKVGPTRIDLWAGMQPMARFIARLAMGKLKTSTGEIVDIERDEAAWAFIRSKLAPLPGVAADIQRGETMIGESMEFNEATIKRESYELLVPLHIQEMRDALKEGGWKHFWLAWPEMIGAAVQTYTTTGELYRRTIAEDTAAGLIKPGPYEQFGGIPDHPSGLTNEDEEAFWERHPELQQEEAEREAERLEEGQPGATYRARAESQRTTWHGKLDDIIADIRSGKLSPFEAKDSIHDWQSGYMGAKEELREANADYFAQFDEEPRNAPEAAVNEYIDMLEAMPKRLQEPRTDEDWDRRDNYIARNISPATLKLAQETLAFDDHPYQIAKREIEDEAEIDWDRYYDLDEGKPRDLFRSRVQNAKYDALLFALGRASTIRSTRARKLAQDYIKQLYGFTMPLNEIPFPKPSRKVW